MIIDDRRAVETRSWGTKFRGTIAIHAGKKVDKNDCLKTSYDPLTIAKGAILGTARLVDCVQFPHPSVKPDAYGDFTPGRFGWILDSIRKFSTPVPMKGSLGLWEWLIEDTIVGKF